MNAMQDIHVRARQGSLAGHAHESYLASEAFAQRLAFVGEQGVADKVAMVLYMLKHVALDPRQLDSGLAALERGTVHLNFFGWSNPVPMLEVHRAEDLESIRQAVKANAGGALFRAALRVIKWRGRQAAGERGRNAVMARVRAGIVWPTGRDDASRQEQERLVALLNTRADALRDRRRTRMAALSGAAGPRSAGWTEFLAAMAGDALAQRVA